MSTSRGTWKAAERRVAGFFGTQRTALSGGNSKITRSDSMHKKLFIEAKLRVKHAVVSLWRETKVLAEKEGKIPVICLNEKGKEGFWIMCHSSDFCRAAKLIEELGFICQGCAIANGALWPEGLCATMHSGVCPECGETKSLASVDDWNWPEGSKRPCHGAGRD